ncbi:electron transport complex subunit RsxC [Oceanisphaera profunda]|uniref:Ion-translocating oxidoreductase complex subunit C n=1 Tax=Oceanisphaera profunda TaxID=1416627 RepID=A0A1Y0D2S7_9GAMM|nr:electron transport complex subunit RsxC [Oceanisphaera profunda]ART81395.1 electron transport complex subunit RsxC [Oceanisphaera profunda]
MSSLKPLLNNLKAAQLHTFHGGIHPPERKAPANLTPISDAGLPEELVLQVRQHIGQAAQLSVSVGDQVLKGQTLTEPLNPMMVPVHAPTSGVISAIENRPLCHPSGLSGLCIVLKPDGQERWRARFPVADYHLLEPDVLLTRLHQAGITGLGGAGFPAHVKLAARKPAQLSSTSAPAVSAGKSKDAHADGISTLIINGVECEPYISADDRLMREHADEILQGIAILRHIVQPKLTILAVEDNKPEALAALTAALKATNQANQDDSLQIIAIPTKYPSGGEKQLIEVLTGLQVPHQGLPSDLGIVMQNVGTVYAIQQAIINDEPLIRRVVTLAGDAFATPGNAWVHIGTPVRYLLKRYGLTAEREQRIIMGGPMMGFTLHSAAAPIIKGSNCILAPKYAELAPPAEEMPCIRCSLCADACPASLLPQQLYWYARSEEHDKLESHNLFDCIECGACAYVCPSNIPLVEYYRIAKADIRHARHEADQAERAKIRFEARQERLAVEKAERQARQAKAAADRKARMAEQAAKTGIDPVAAALARVKTRQLSEATDGQTTAPQDMTALRAARKEEARRNRALKAAQAAGAGNSADENAQISSTHTEENTGSANVTQGKNPAVVAALARAKARKAAEAAATDDELNTDSATATPAKNPAVAAAIAKAKAAQAEASKRDSGNERVDHKKEAIKAAVARAKARQEAELQAARAALNPDVIASEAQLKNDVSAENNAADESTAATKNTAASENTAPADAKKAAIQAAVARAKARKAAQAAELVTEPKPIAQTPSAVDNSKPEVESGEPVDAKKAAIQAAVARAKARKVVQAAEPVTEPKPIAQTPSAVDNSKPEVESGEPVDAKKAAIKAAVARAKARQAAKLAGTQPEQASDQPSDKKEDES